MDALPPPQLPQQPEAGPDQGRSRLAIGGIAALVAVVVAGGLVVGSQLVGADRPSISTSSAAAPIDDAPGDETPTDEPGDGAQDSDDAPADDRGSDGPGLDLAEVTADFEAFERCLDEQLGGVFGKIGRLGADDWNGSVVVENLGGDGAEALSVFDFGSGDGSVVVTKTGDTITVEATGDVTTFDTSFFEEGKAEWEAAEQACADLLPDDLPVFDMELGDLPLDEMLGDLPLDEMFESGDFGTLLDEMFESGDFGTLLDEMFESGDFGTLLDEATLAELENMFETGDFGELGRLIEDKVGTLDGSGTGTGTGG